MLIKNDTFRNRKATESVFLFVFFDFTDFGKPDDLYYPEVRTVSKQPRFQKELFAYLTVIIITHLLLSSIL